MIKAYSKSERQSSVIAQELLTKFQKKIKERKSNHSSSTLIANCITIANQQSIEPFLYQVPTNFKNIKEDQKPVRKFPKRSFSANIHKKSIKNVEKCVDKLLIREGLSSKNLSFKSFRSYVSNSKYKLCSDEAEQKNYKLIPLQTTNDDQDYEDRIIDIMRKQKINAQHYDKLKNKFIKQIPHQFQRQKQEQKRFANAYLTKDHTYSKKGEVIEISKKKKRIKRKTVNDVHPFKLGSRRNNDSLYQAQSLCIDYRNWSEQDQKVAQYIFRQKKDNQQKKRAEQSKYSKNRTTKFFELKEDT